MKRLWSVFCVCIGRANKSALGWQENANADKNQCTLLPNPQTLARRFGSFSKQAVHLHTRAHFHTDKSVIHHVPMTLMLHMVKRRAEKISTQLCGWLQLGSQRGPEVHGVETTQWWWYSPVLLTDAPVLPHMLQCRVLMCYLFDLHHLKGLNPTNQTWFMYVWSYVRKSVFRETVSVTLDKIRPLSGKKGENMFWQVSFTVQQWKSQLLLLLPDRGTAGQPAHGV